MKVICVDDEKFVLADLLETIKEIPEIVEATGFRNISEAFDFIQTHSVQIAFLDSVFDFVLNFLFFQHIL